MSPRQRSQILDRDWRILWLRSGNMCAFREGRTMCAQRLVGDDEALFVVGEMAHIVGLHPGSARYDSSLPTKSRNSHENLILLCPTHHRTIDDRDARHRFTADGIRSMKSRHERWVKEQMSFASEREGGAMPELRAEFEIDPDTGGPITYRFSSGGKLHYVLNLWVVGAPADTRSVIYGLHPTFETPAIRITKGPTFRLEELKTYGDFFVKITLKQAIDQTPIVLHYALSQALRRHYGKRATQSQRASILRLSQA